MEETEDPFNRLPNELIVLVFDKVSEAKWLCWCSLVSKRFASLVLQTRVVTIKLLKSNKTLSLSQRLFRLLKTPFRFFIPKPHLFYEISVTKSLKEFTSIETLEIQVFHPRNLKNDSVVKGRLYFKNSEVNTFVLLFAMKRAEGDDDAQREALLKLFFRHLANACEGILVLKCMIYENVKFDKAVIRNSPKYGSVFLGRENIVQITNAMLQNRWSYKIWHSADVHLSSGQVMKGLKLALVKFCENESEEEAVIVRKAFEGEEDSDSREAAMEISTGMAMQNQQNRVG